MSQPTSDVQSLKRFFRDRVFADVALGDAAGHLAELSQSHRIGAGEPWPIDVAGEARVGLIVEGLAVQRALASGQSRLLETGAGFTFGESRLSDAEVELLAVTRVHLVTFRQADYTSIRTDPMPTYDEVVASLLPASDEPAPALPAGTRDSSGSDTLNTRVGQLMSRDPHIATPGTSVQAAARLMHEHAISCLPVVADESSKRLLGLVTEADLAGRVLAEGRGADTPVGDIMTREPETVSPAESLFDVLLLMTQGRYAHMPVVDGESLVGILTQTDLVRRQTASPMFLVREIEESTSSAAIAAQLDALPRLLLHLIDGGVGPFDIGRVLSGVTDSVTRRLIALAESELGAAPVPYLWLACGSQGRREQTGVSDQDNCLILSADFRPDEHGSWFESLARRVCDGLNEAGYVYCPGDMMAINPEWRQPVNIWRGYFEGWIDRPERTAQMLASVMFDLRAIHGDTRLYEELQGVILEQAASNSLFIAHMTSNALTHRPPLGLFGRISVERRGEKRGRVDLKHGGLVPIIDIARLHALAGSVRESNTVLRLQHAEASASAVLSSSGARDLLDAYDHLASVRLDHQARQIRRGEVLDNYLDPRELSRFERERVREAMLLVRNLQSALSSRQGGMS